MAYTYPLSTTDFMALMPVAEISFDDPAQVEVNQTAGGEVITGAVGAQLWQGDVTLGAMVGNEQSTPDVLLSLLRVSGASFYAYDTRRPAPFADPTGSILGAAVPTIATLVAGNREIALAGLPANYVLTRGDYLAFDYGTPSRRALHKVVAVTVQANVSGTTPNFEVTPALRPGAVVGATVTLVRAACKAKLVPGSVSKGRTKDTITRDGAFRFIQSLRG